MWRSSAFSSIGMLLVILNGGIDLSVGSTLGLCGVIAGFLMQGVHAADVRRRAVSAGLGGRAFWPARLARFVGARQRRADRVLQGAGLRRHLGRHVRRARRRAPDDQRPDLQQSRRPGRTRQHRLRLARLQPPGRRSDRRRGAGGHRHHRQPRADPNRLRPLALCLRRQRARGRALRRAGQDACRSRSTCCPGICAADRRPHPVLAADLGGANRRHHLRIDRDRGGRHRRRGADGRPRHRPRHACSAPSSSASCPTGS